MQWLRAADGAQAYHGMWDSVHGAPCSFTAVTSEDPPAAVYGGSASDCVDVTPDRDEWILHRVGEPIAVSDLETLALVTD